MKIFSFQALYLITSICALIPYYDCDVEKIDIRTAIASRPYERTDDDRGDRVFTAKSD